MRPLRNRVLRRVSGAALATLLLVEVALRLVLGNLSIMEMVELDPDDGRCVGLRPGITVPYTGFLWKIPAVAHDVNELGYRGPARERRKPPGVLRVAVLGDSFAYGQAVRAEETIPAYLEQELATTAIGAPVEVLNFGVPGLNAEEYLPQFERFAVAWQPDLVLIYLFENDLEPPMCEMARADTFWWYLRNVYVFRLIAFASRMYGESRPEAERPVERLRDALGTLAASVRTAGAGAAVVVLGDPIRHALHDDENEPVSPLLEEVLGEAALPWLDMTPETWGPQIPGEGHFTPEGNRDAAVRTADWLQAANLLQRTPPRP